MLTEAQKRTAQAIVNIFETGRANGDYAAVTVIPGDPGHLTYGRSQTTLASGNLFLLISDYCGSAGSEFADALSVFLDRLRARDFSLDRDRTLQQLLRAAGEDPVMQDIQDQFFDRVYWTPAMEKASAAGIGLPLGVAVVYDSTVHGSWDTGANIKKRTINRFGDVAQLSEKTWIGRYVETRKDWLANHPTIPILRKTTYRMVAFEALIAADNWDLTLPFAVRGVTLDNSLLAGASMRVSAQDEESDRLLLLQRPFLRGPDVRSFQQALVARGLMQAAEADGVFGPTTDAVIREFQRSQGLKVDGIVGPATRAALASLMRSV
jgi:chitosanase